MKKYILHQFKPKMLSNTKYDVDAHLAYGVKLKVKLTSA
jgi:hypothetical protein